MSSIPWPGNTHAWESQKKNEDEGNRERQHSSFIWSELKRCELWAKAESDGSAWVLFDVVSGQYDMLSQGKYQLSCQVME